MRDYLELTKPRITLLILVCTAVGYCLAAEARSAMVLVHALLGTALLASGTSALNQWYEVDSDAKMRRTRNRPFPAGRMKRSHAFYSAYYCPSPDSRSCGTARICLRPRSACSRF